MRFSSILCGIFLVVALPFSAFAEKETIVVCHNSDTVVSFKPDGDTSLFLWQIRPDGQGWSNRSDWSRDSVLKLTKLTASLDVRYLRDTNHDGVSDDTTDLVSIRVYNPLAAGTIGDVQTICNSAAPTALILKSNATGGDGTFTYQWQILSNGSTWNDIDGETGNSYQPGNLTQSAHYRLKFTSGSGCGTVYSESVQITVLPVLQAGTIGDGQTICYNIKPQKLHFKNWPSGADNRYTFQWQQADIDGVFDDIPNATADTYEADALLTSKRYRMVVSSTTCGTNATTDPILITVHAELKPGTIGEMQTICHNTQPAKLNMKNEATGGDRNYIHQWQSSPNESSWNNINGATGNSYQPGNLTQSTYYRLKFTSGSGCGEVYSEAILITVRQELKPGTIGEMQTICHNTQPAKLTIKSDATGGDESYSYLWQDSTTGKTWQNISEATNNEYRPAQLTQSAHYRLLFVSGHNCGTVASNAALINVRPELKSGTIGETQTICHNTAPNTIRFSTNPSGADTNYTYQWQKAAFGRPDNEFTPIDGATNNTLAPGTLTDSTQYRVMVKSVACNTTAITDAINIHVLPQFITGTIDGTTQTICYNAIPEQLKLISNPTGSNGVYDYAWQDSTANGKWNMVKNNTNSTSHTPNALSNSTYYRLEIKDGFKCGTLYTNTVFINVRPKLEPGTIGKEQTICYNTKPDSITHIQRPTGGDSVYDYQWQQSFDQNSWGNINEKTDTLYQPDSLKQTIHYRLRFTDHHQCDTVYSAHITIKVYSQLNAGILNDHQTICHNTAPNTIQFSVAPSGEDGRYTYQWQQVPFERPDSEFADMTDKTGNTLSLGQLSASTRYRVIVSSPKCKTFDTTAAVNIHVLPIFIPGKIDSTTQTICYNAAPDALKLISRPTGSSGRYAYQWQDSSNQSLWKDISANGKDTAYTAPGLKQSQYFRLRFSDAQFGCVPVYSNTIFINVRPKLEPGTIGKEQTICYNTKPDSITHIQRPTGGDSVYDYQWQQSFDQNSWGNINEKTDTLYQPDSLKQTIHYRLRFTDHHQCDTVYSAHITIKVYSQLNAGILNDHQTICHNTAPNTIQFSVAPSGEDGRYTYQWQQVPFEHPDSEFADMTDKTANTLSLGPLADSTRYRVIVSSPKCQTFDTTSDIAIHVLSPLLPGKIASSDTICQHAAPETLQLLLPCSGSDHNYSYQWQCQTPDDNAFIDIAENARNTSYQSPPLDLPGSHYFRLSFNDGHLCGPVYSDTVKIQVHQLPQKRNLLGDFSVCRNQSDLEYFFNETEPLTSYEWSVEGGSITKQIDTNHIVVHWDSVAGEGHITLLQTYVPLGCLSDDNLYTIEKTAYAAPNKTPIIRKGSTNILICAENTPGTIYQWGFRNLATGEETLLTESNYQYMQMPHSLDFDIYTYFVLTSFQYDNTISCTTKSFFIENLAPEQPQVLERDFVIYPNPTRHDFFIQTQEAASSDCIVTISTIEGKLVFKRTYPADETLYCHPELLPGLYIVSLHTTHGKISKKLIIVE